MQRQNTVLLRKEEVKVGRVTMWRLVCSECGSLDPPLRSKMMLRRVADEHGAEDHRFERVSLLP